ncbi:hypothetical protein A2U01_0101145, partial [Trifolium medium]|nr:hypothetical protein [Trifolium medium]
MDDESSVSLQQTDVTEDVPDKESINVVVDDLLVERIADCEDDVGTSFQQLDAPYNVPDI